MALGWGLRGALAGYAIPAFEGEKRGRKAKEVGRREEKGSEEERAWRTNKVNVKIPRQMELNKFTRIESINWAIKSFMSLIYIQCYGLSTLWRLDSN